MSFVRTCLIAGVIGSYGSAVFALPQPTIEVAFSSGRVTVNAADAAVADLLRAWTQVGHTQVTGIENLGVRRITLRLPDAPEEAALTAIVGQRSWFNAIGRSFTGASESTFGRIDILPAARSANVTAPTPEQRYEYPQTAPTPEVAGWASPASTSAGSPRPQAYPETMYDYPTLGGFGDPYKMVATASASNEQPIIQPGAEPPVPERIYEYPATPNMPQWMKPLAPIPDLPVEDGFIDGVLPGERVDLNSQRTVTSTTAATLNVPDTSDRPYATI